eukprot:Em0008g469a
MGKQGGVQLGNSGGGQSGRDGKDGDGEIRGGSPMGNMVRSNGGMVVGGVVGPHSLSGGAEAGKMVFGTRGIGLGKGVGLEPGHIRARETAIGTDGGEEPESDPPRLAGAGGGAGGFFRSLLHQ